MGGEPGASTPADEDATDQAVELRRMRRAVAEIRREGWKVAVIYATLDAALATLLANLALAVARPSFLPASVPIPSAVVDALRRGAGVSLADPTLSAASVVGVALGVVVFAVEVAVRVRRPLVEQFESANPGLYESLRTARDAVEDGRDTPIARRLYEEVIDELRRSSSVGLLDVRRVVATALVVVVVSLATVQVAVVDLSLGGVDGGAGGPGGGPTGGVAPEDYGGLQDPSGILGEPEDVPAGVENQNATIDTSGSGAGDGADPVASYADSGYAGSGDVDSQRASFAEGEQLEDAELIREYNLRIRGGADG